MRPDEYYVRTNAMQNVTCWIKRRRRVRSTNMSGEFEAIRARKVLVVTSLSRCFFRNLEKKRRDAFFAVLDDHPKITTQTRWKDARRIIQDEEETFSKVASNSERVSRVRKSVSFPI